MTLLWDGQSGDRIPVEVRFSTHIHTGPETHPDSYTNGRGSFPVVKWPGCGVEHPSPSSAEVKERVQLYTYSASSLCGLSRLNFTFT
jgi:hypothetical protein